MYIHSTSHTNHSQSIPLGSRPPLRPPSLSSPCLPFPSLLLLLFILHCLCSFLFLIFTPSSFLYTVVAPSALFYPPPPFLLHICSVSYTYSLPPLPPKSAFVTLSSSSSIWSFLFLLYIPLPTL